MKMCRTPREDDFVIITGEEIIRFKNYIKRALHLNQEVKGN